MARKFVQVVFRGELCSPSRCLEVVTPEPIQEIVTLLCSRTVTFLYHVWFLDPRKWWQLVILLVAFLRQRKQKVRVNLIKQG